MNRFKRWMLRGEKPGPDDVWTGERILENLTKHDQEEGCAACLSPLDSDSLISGGIVVHVPLCREHTQLVARRALARKLGELVKKVFEASD